MSETKKKKSFQLNADETAFLAREIDSTRKWLIVSGVIALIIFGGAAVLGLAGFFIGLIRLTSQPAFHPSAQTDMAIFIIAGILGVSFCAVCIWLGAAALLTAARGKAYLVTGSSADLLAYHQRMKRVFVTIGGIAVFGIVMCIIFAALAFVAFAGFGMGVVD
ncbi:hypothetical protein GF359_05490 [candidate division WOR-3 bacterium]|uniref:DUF5362 domain-containing protein n=1 Tax=candidate division WOR-3 bacterium TaxID=2052148 RepID=A0A9D5QCK2_UNCW3|nr:hypothetical protein [candidate division WOR-3 bacterium]MBD3364649.1 hypothetical protein [candidate division WOR-3 bacterium]